MCISARNQIAGTVKKLIPGAVNTEVVVDAGGTEIVSIITKESAEHLGLKVGASVKAVIKASSVLISTD